MTSPTWVISPAVAAATALNQRRRKIRVLAHEAAFLHSTQPERSYHLKVTNLSPSREIEISHIWFELQNGQQLHLLNPARPLPARLRLDETYETWLPVARASRTLDWADRFRVKLSSGAVFMSRLNRSVPPVGSVAGGGEPPYAATLSTGESIGVTGVGPDTFKVWDPISPSTSASATHDPRGEPDCDPEGKPSPGGNI